jgi:hypothetical protein
MVVPKRMTNKDLLALIDRNREKLETSPDHPLILNGDNGDIITDLGVNGFKTQGAYFTVYIEGVEDEGDDEED